jgi:hypothetical protein
MIPKGQGGGGTRGGTLLLYWKEFFKMKGLAYMASFNQTWYNPYSCMKGIQVYSYEGPSPFQRGVNHKSEKNRVESFKEVIAWVLKTNDSMNFFHFCKFCC